MIQQSGRSSRRFSSSCSTLYLAGPCGLAPTAHPVTTLQLRVCHGVTRVRRGQRARGERGTKQGRKRQTIKLINNIYNKLIVTGRQADRQTDPVREAQSALMELASKLSRHCSKVNPATICSNAAPCYLSDRLPRAFAKSSVSIVSHRHPPFLALVFPFTDHQQMIRYYRVSGCVGCRV